MLQMIDFLIRQLLLLLMLILGSMLDCRSVFRVFDRFRLLCSLIINFLGGVEDEFSDKRRFSLSLNFRFSNYRNRLLSSLSFLALLLACRRFFFLGDARQVAIDQLEGLRVQTLHGVPDLFNEVVDFNTCPLNGEVKILLRLLRLHFRDYRPSLFLRISFRLLL